MGVANFVAEDFKRFMHCFRTRFRVARIDHLKPLLFRHFFYSLKEILVSSQNTKEFLRVILAVGGLPSGLFITIDRSLSELKLI